MPEQVLNRQNPRSLRGGSECTITLDRLWRAARFTSSYADPDSDSSESAEDNFEDGLDFQEQEVDESIAGIRRRLSEEAEVSRVGEALNQTLSAERDEVAPREHFSPVQVRFPVNAPALRPPPVTATEVIMPDQVDFEDENAQDGAKALEYSRSLSLEFNPTEVEFWFMQLENEMYTCQIKSQWMKRCILVKNLPPKIQNDVKTLLTIKQSQAPADIYKKIKQEVLRIHAPRKEDKFKKALSRVLTGLPSQLGQTLITDICLNPGAKLEGCCCAHIVYTLWTLQLPVAVRSHVASMVFDKDTYQEVFESADKVFLSTKVTDVSAGIAAINDFSGSAASQGEVAAVTKPNRGGRGRGRGRGGRGTKPSVPSNCCTNHKKWQSDAWFCLEPLTCPWASKVSAKPTTPQGTSTSSNSNNSSSK